jgi:sigma-B regulation protein RsbU (phosphoserine phosphatase)
LVVAFLLQLTIADYREQVRAILRTDAPAIVLGILFVAVAICALALYRLRARSKDPALLWFFLYAALYGLRLLANAQSVRFISGVPEPFWAYFRAAITYVITLPSLLFVREIIPAWRRVLGWAVVTAAVFAMCGIASDQALGRPESLHAINNILVLIMTFGLLIPLLRQGRGNPEVRALQAGVLIFATTVAAVNLWTLARPLAFDPEPLAFAAFLVALGRVLALRTVKNEQRLGELDKELEIARRIQLSILPREMPAMRRVSVAARYVPMTAVAGDFYEFLQIDSQRLGILIADVSGHGVPAALIASMVKIATAAQLPHADDPARVLQGMNETLCGKLQGQFVTAAYVFLDLEGQTMRYAAAGHPPLLVRRAASEQVEEIVENGLVLGLVSAATYTCVERNVTQGDRFILYTDGLLEASNANDEQFGDQRARNMLVNSSGLGTEECATWLMDELARWAGYANGRPQEDDLTVIVVDVRDEAAGLLTA